MIEKNFDDISPTGSSTHHNKNPSFLTKDFSISRHERRKSAMEIEAAESQGTYEGNKDALTVPNASNYNTASQAIKQMGQNEHGILKSNLSVND